LPDSVTTLGKRVFDGCQYLKTADLGKGLTAIPDDCFYWDLKLNVVKVPSTVTTIGSYSFLCETLREIHFDGTMEQWNAITKTSSWDAGTEGYVVICKDGKMCKQHLGGKATCQKLANCKFCGEEYGSLASCNFKTNKDTVYTYYSSSYHRYVPNCTVCGKEPGANSTYSASHSGGTATCSQKAICEYCKHEYGSTLEHEGVANANAEWEYYDNTSHVIEATCSKCNSSTQIIEKHTGGTATCQSKAKCTQCNSEYGNLGAHVMSNGACTLCGSNVTTIETAHNPYANNENSVVVGTWDYSSAQSVTITITYQTESTSYDWIYLKSGDNYIDLNGNVTTTATKIGGNTKTTKTFTTTATSGSVIFRTDGSVNSYYGVQVIVTPNY
jgi:hypothetical protein